MDNTRLTIACEENREGGYEIDVTFERDSRTKFREAFISLDRPMPPYLIEENDINGVGAIKSATTSILSHIKNVIGKSMKTDSRILLLVILHTAIFYGENFSVCVCFDNGG